jgi:site-specific recombinase XerD
MEGAMFVYVIRGSQGLYKIGRTIDLETRLRMLPGEMRRKWGITAIELVLAIPTDDAYRDQRRAGEWFALTEQDLQALAENLPEPRKTRAYRKPPTYLKTAERDELLSVFAAIEHPRDKAIVTLFLFGGLRRNELVMLDRADADLRYRTVHIRYAKGGKERTVGLHRMAEAAIRDYLATRHDQHPALFLSSRRQRISKRTINYLLEKYVARCEFALRKRVTPHCLRHTFATALMRATNRDLQIVQRALGHSKVETTAIYAHLDDDVLYSAMEKL